MKVQFHFSTTNYALLKCMLWRIHQGSANDGHTVVVLQLALVDWLSVVVVMLANDITSLMWRRLMRGFSVRDVTTANSTVHSTPANSLATPQQLTALSRNNPLKDKSYITTHQKLDKFNNCWLVRTDHHWRVFPGSVWFWQIQHDTWLDSSIFLKR